MKTAVSYKFDLDVPGDLQELEVSSYEFVILKGLTRYGQQWDPEKETTIEVQEETKLLVTMSPSDARELANNLIKAAEFAEQNGPAQQRVGGRLR